MIPRCSTPADSVLHRLPVPPAPPKLDSLSPAMSKSPIFQEASPCLETVCESFYFLATLQNFIFRMKRSGAPSRRPCGIKGNPCTSETTRCTASSLAATYCRNLKDQFSTLRDDCNTSVLSSARSSTNLLLQCKKKSCGYCSNFARSLSALRNGDGWSAPRASVGTGRGTHCQITTSHRLID